MYTDMVVVMETNIYSYITELLVLGHADSLPDSCIAVIGPTATDYQVQFCCGHCAYEVIMGTQNLWHLVGVWVWVWVSGWVDG